MKKKNSTAPDEATDTIASNAYDQAEFVANIGHDLKTYLNPIIGFTSVLLLDKAGLDSDQVHQLDLIYSSARQLLKRIDAMVEFQRLSTGAPAGLVDWVSTREVFLEVNQIFQDSAAQRGISLVDSLETAPARLRTNRMMLNRVLNELVANALKFTETGTVTLTAKRGEPPEPQKVRLRFCVVDTGSGIGPKPLAVLQASLEAAPDLASQSFAGLGLGLALAREAARRLGGGLEVKSTPNQGSTFSLIVDFFEDDLEE